MKVSHVSVYNWIEEFGSRVQEINSDEIIPVAELEEMHTYIKSKKTAAGPELPSTD